MTAVALQLWNKTGLQAIALGGIAIAVWLILRTGIMFNQALAVALALIVLTIWRYNRVSGTIAAIIFFLIKAFFVRIAFTVDYRIFSSGGPDLLAITPALLLAGLIVWQIYLDVSAGQKVLGTGTRRLLALFCLIAIASIFYPTNSVINGLAGFERNILPNMMVLFLTASVFRGTDDLHKLLKTLLVLGLVSCVYALGQFAVGMYSWEKDWLLHVAFRETTSGWLTIGLRGAEFRLYSLFYGYMDFTFTNVLIFAIVLAHGKDWNTGWRRIRLVYIIAWLAVLFLGLERMALVMTLIAAAVMYLIKSSVKHRKQVAWAATVGLMVFYIGLAAAGPYLQSTRAAKYVRLAELANPFNAVSVGLRVEKNWLPTIAAIKSNPLGTGIGCGSQTRVARTGGGVWLGPHNELLQKTLETGILGGLVFLLLCVSIFRDARWLSRFPGLPRRFGYGMISATVAFWVCSIVNLPFSGASGLVYWAMAGVMLGILPAAREKSPKRTLDVDKSEWNSAGGSKIPRRRLSMRRRECIDNPS